MDTVKAVLLVVGAIMVGLTAVFGVVWAVFRFHKVISATLNSIGQKLCGFRVAAEQE